MIYIGLDQSLSGTGVAIYNTESQTIAVFKIAPESLGEPDGQQYMRVRSVRDSVCQLLDLLQPAWLFVEEPYLARGGKNNTKTYKILCILMGSLIISALERGVRYTTVDSAPTKNDSWPKALLSTGTKEAFRLLIPDCPKEVSMDESDAIGVLWGGLYLNGLVEREDLPKQKITRLNYVNINPNSPPHRRAKAGQFNSQLLEALMLLEVRPAVLA